MNIIKVNSINKLSEHLHILRIKAKLTQEEIAAVIGVSRQTYCQIENKNIVMPWYIYMSLIMAFNSKDETRDLMHMVGIHPEEVVNDVVEAAVNSKNERS